ncbi:MAG: RHS repeat protein [Oscillospiraceae bacterium]|nr:RHS repeat protein [Oscillospiraceae bacterium]
MKKAICLLLLLSLALSLCACGDAAPAAATSQPAEGTAEDAAPTAAAAPEKTYTEVEKELVTEEREIGMERYDLRNSGPVMLSGDRITAYAYDEFGQVTGETVRYEPDTALTFLQAAWAAETFDEGEGVVRDDKGALLSVTTLDAGIRYENGFTWTTEDTGYFEDGVLTRVERRYVGNAEIPAEIGTLAEEVSFEYHPNGALKCETAKIRFTRYNMGIYVFDTPATSIREYDEAGRCTRWRSASAGVTDSEVVMTTAAGTLLNNTAGEVADEYRWTLGGEGRPVGMQAVLGEGGAAAPKTIEAEMRYDEAGRMVSAVRTDESGTTNYAYEYDEDGRLSAVTRKSGSGELRSLYEYNADGLLAAERRPDGDVIYTWEPGSYAAFYGTVSDKDSRRSAFRQSSLYVFGEELDELENTKTTHEYTLLISAMDLEPIYIDHAVRQRSEVRTVLVEAAP